ncbi:hypothetical protein CMESO_80 (nucleomorph) [Chroomonas mesostigmatica CCMP1168]|uniref:Uncharacterized protein n=1 Tax=Chroomonas mesostigmatica CCMP1168 TaxID=1195612 RepID=J7G2N0_9CRYP|nr:hypothetical protein CMESO_80 [Chroomonas mesostigmatica CCMP1168]
MQKKNIDKINIEDQPSPNFFIKKIFKKIFFYPKIWKKNFFGISISLLLKKIFFFKFFNDFEKTKKNFYLLILSIFLKLLKKNLKIFSILFLKNQEESLYSRAIVIVLNYVFDEKFQFLLSTSYFRNDLRFSTINRKFSLKRERFLDFILIKIFFSEILFSSFSMFIQSRKYYFKKGIFPKIKSKLKYFKKIYNSNIFLFRLNPDNHFF